jgi:adenine deaminase
MARESGGRLRTVDVVRMATLTPAEFFHMPYRGRLGIGTRADVAVVEDLEEFRVVATYRNGQLVARDGRVVNDVADYPYHENILHSVNVRRVFTADDFAVRASDGRRRVRAIRIIPGQILTGEAIEEVEVRDGGVRADPSRDLLKVAVIERHRGRNNHAVGFVRGFGIREGAVALTIGHDSHNLAVVGATDEEMAFAVGEMVRMQGGVVVVRGERVLASLPLRIGGLMSTEAPEEVVRGKRAVYDAYKELGGPLDDPIITLSFLQLPVIPELKISDKCLIEMSREGPRKVPVLVD